MGNIGLPQLLIVLVLVLLVFGTKRIRSLGSDLGGAIRDFRKGVGEDADGDKTEAASGEAPDESARGKDAPAGSEPGKD